MMCPIKPGTTANGNGGNYRYYVCRSRLEYGAKHCSQDRLPADDVERDIIHHALQTLRNDDLLREAWDLYADTADDRNSKEQDELGSLDKQASRLRSSIDKYLDAFESGTMPPDACSPRLQDIQNRLAEVEERRDELRVEADADIGVPGLQRLLLRRRGAV